MPLDLAEGAARRESKHTARIQKVREHEAFGEAESFQPPESHAWQQGWRMGYRGRVLAALGAVALAAGLLRGGGSLLLNGWILLSVGLIGIGVAQVLRGRRQREHEVRLPLLKRAALITDRRSDTTIRGWSGYTRYYYTIEFEDGGTGEFGMQGRGVNEEPYTTNLPGVAYTRGETLLHFRHIRV